MNDVIFYQDKYYILASSSIAEEQNSVLKDNEIFGIFDPSGNIRPFGFENHGIFFESTRFLSRFVMNIEDKHPVLLSSTIKHDNDLFVIDRANADFLDHNNDLIEKGTLHCLTFIFFDKQVCYRRDNISNYGLNTIEFHLSYELDADYTDIFEIRGMYRSARGQKENIIHTDDRIIFNYNGLDKVNRKTEVLFSSPPETIIENKAEYLIRIEPGRSCDIKMQILCQIDKDIYESKEYEKAYDFVKNRNKRTQFNGFAVETSNKQFNRWMHRSTVDMIMMMTETEHGLYPYAGIPWYNCVFGRDGIITALECLWAFPEISRSVLKYLAENQAQTVDIQKDAEPGKIIHELRKGEMANLKEIPFGRYYGSVDSTPLFLILAGRYLERTGDLEFIKEIWPSIELAVNWIDEYGDIDKDGFVEYIQKSSDGLSQQGWRDSWDSVFHQDGTIAEHPVALCEVQGYVYEAKILISRMARMLDKNEFADKLLEDSESLKVNFEKVFWDDEMGLYVMAIDSKKQPCRILSSAAGQCLFSGIATEKAAKEITDKLSSRIFYSGWGIRTIANSEIRFNPMSYHNGSVWPHDNALIAYGMARYNLKYGVLNILNGLFEASQFVDLFRLPELFCGFIRHHNQGPILYPVACKPQTWAAVASFMLLQSCLGLHIDAVNQKIYFRNPILPPYIENVRIRNIKIGDAKLNIILERHGEDVGIITESKETGIEIIISR